jgi:putative tricarboxylic transport membrane protein
MRRLENAVNVIWLTLGLAVCAQSYRLGLIGPSGPDSGFFPLLSGIAIVGAAGALLLGRDRVPADATFLPSSGSPRRVVIVLAIMATAVAALPWLGFLLTGVLAMPLLLQSVQRGSWFFAIIFGAAATASVYVVFDRALGTPLPRGMFGI